MHEFNLKKFTSKIYRFHNKCLKPMIDKTLFNFHCLGWGHHHWPWKNLLIRTQNFLTLSGGKNKYLIKLILTYNCLRSKEEDLTEIEKSGCLYQAGIDKQGRPVIVFIGKWFKPDSVNLDQALLYLIRVLNPVVDKDYSVVYFCTR